MTQIYQFYENTLFYLIKIIFPHAILLPAFPVFNDSSSCLFNFIFSISAFRPGKP